MGCCEFPTCCTKKNCMRPQFFFFFFENRYTSFHPAEHITKQGRSVQMYCSTHGLTIVVRVARNEERPMKRDIYTVDDIRIRLSAYRIDDTRLTVFFRF